MQNFRDSDIYRLEQVKGIEDSRTTPLKSSSNNLSPFRRRHLEQNASVYATRQTLDRSSIFVGNLPAHLTQDHLALMFQGYGRILHVEVIRKPSIASST